MNKITIAHSPDADDIFMYYALKFGWIDTKKTFDNIALDIQSLNEEAMRGIFDISAISFALYPLIYKEYALLKTAVSFGEGYGPKLITKKDKILKRNFKVALSGEHTTNALIFKIYYPEARIFYKNFLDIEKSVLNDEVDAGVLIHESILDYHENLRVEKEIWDIWQEIASKDLPLPLGGMAMRRSLNLLDAILYENSLIKAVLVAVKYKKILSNMLLERNLVRVDEEKLDKYLSLYANENSAVLNEEQLQAIDVLFELGYKNGFYPNLIKAKDCLIPSEYEKLRKQ